MKKLLLLGLLAGAGVVAYSQRAGHPEVPEDKEHVGVSGARVDAVRAPIQERREVSVRGIVQGVGFRPFVYALARRHGLTGLVRNDAEGVYIEVEGDVESLDLFVRGIEEDAPPLAVVEAVAWRPLAALGERDFRIEESREGVRRRALVSPDVATCEDCLAGGLRSLGPPLPLPVHQLHQLRSALHHNAAGPLRPRHDHDVPLRRCAPNANASTKTPPTAASTPSRTPALPAARGYGCWTVRPRAARETGRPHPAHGQDAAGTGHRRRQGPRGLPPRLRPIRRAGGEDPPWPQGAPGQTLRAHGQGSRTGARALPGGTRRGGFSSPLRRGP